MKRLTKGWLGVTGILIAPGLAGCGAPSSYAVTDPAPTPRSVSAALSNGLTATVTEDRSTVPVGGVVTYTMTLANNTAQPITYQPMRQVAFSVGVGDALVVRNAQGSVTYPGGEYGQELTAGPSSTLAPGQSVSATEPVGIYNTGGAFAPAGRYFASVTFTVQTAAGTSVSATTRPLEVDAQ